MPRPRCNETFRSNTPFSVDAWCLPNTLVLIARDPEIAKLQLVDFASTADAMLLTPF